MERVRSVEEETIEPAKLYVDHVGNTVAYDGQQPLIWRVSAYAMAIRDDAILMVEPVWAARWDLPGGGVELDTQETLVDGAIRECWEETGYRFTPTAAPQFVAELFFLLRQPDQFCHSLLFAVRGTVADQPDPTWSPDSDEIRSVRWLPLASLSKASVHKPHWDALRLLQLV